MNGSSPPKATHSARPVCEPAVRRWAIISVAAFIALAWGGAFLVLTGHIEGPVLPLFFAGIIAVLGAHLKLYRAVRDDIVMEPEANARLLQRFRWYGPAAALEVLFFVQSGHSRR